MKSYDLAWGDGNAAQACELLADQARRAVETEMSNRTLGGLALNCPARMKEVLELLGPEDKAQLEELAKRTESVAVSGEESGAANIEIAPGETMALTEVAGSWYVEGADIQEIEPIVVALPGENKAEHNSPEEVEEAEAEEAGEAFSEEEGAAAAAEDGIVDPASQEKKIEETLGIEFHEPASYVSCPTGVPAEVGVHYACLAEMESGKRFTLLYRITDNEGDLSELSQKPNHEY